MQIISVSEHSSCSFFLIGRSYDLLSFNIDQNIDLRNFISGVPVIGSNIGEIVRQKYRYQFLKLISKSFNEVCFSTEVIFAENNSVEGRFQFVFTPIIENNEECVACTVIKTDARSYKYYYNGFIFNQLRASTTNILSLLNTMNYVQMKSFDILKINQLLTNINLQSEKLDNVINKLYSVLIQNENSLSSEKEFVSERKQHIVLVDDDIITSKLHKTLIEKHQNECNVVLFHDPEAALLYIEESNPDLILLDLHMPEIDGFRFLQMLKDRHLFVDVIIVSSSLDTDERSRVRSYNFVKDFIVKPLTNEKVKLMFGN